MAKRDQNREQHGSHPGRFTYEGQWDRLCRCGHTLGQHAGVRDNGRQPCMADEHGGADGGDCKCECFVPVRKKAS